MNGLEVLPEYQKEVLFSRPYYVYKLQLAVRKGETPLHDRRGAERTSSPSATLSGSAAERSLMNRFINPPPCCAPTTTRPACSSIWTTATWTPSTSTCRSISYYLPQYPNLELIGEPGEKGYYAIAFRKADGGPVRPVRRRPRPADRRR